uniref:Exonuclease domain-containing protein n=1 Tax=Timspurckia oligopyrenoides TaxID=708627 RepID=A0A7S1EUF4_9RHOD|mmetsp:Transcript_8623/g.15590  ORF Transcript_8623/g.15590 Transcript_8623/m.15590 type:complete len:336 (+) Transcript_8623:28-1035(+)
MTMGELRGIVKNSGGRRNTKKSSGKRRIGTKYGGIEIGNADESLDVAISEAIQLSKEHDMVAPDIDHVKSFTEQPNISDEIIPVESQSDVKVNGNASLNAQRNSVRHRADSNWKQLLASGAIRKPEKPLAYAKARHHKEKSSKRFTASQHTTHSLCGIPEGVERTRVIALDCEFVGVGVEGKFNAPARVSIVNFKEETLMDVYVRIPHDQIVDYRTEVSGITREKLEGSDAIAFGDMQRIVKEICESKIVVGHGLSADLDALRIDVKFALRRDTAMYKPIRNAAGLHRSKRPALRVLASRLLSMEIQTGQHDSRMDAIAALRLYKLFSKDWSVKK